MNRIKHNVIIILVINVIFVCGIVANFYFFGTGYQSKIRQQNLSDIENINRSSANISSTFFQNRQGRLSDIVQYATRQNFTRDQLLSYICDSNSGDEIFELVGTDATGYAAVRSGSGFPSLDYTALSYANFAKVFSDSSEAAENQILYTQEFTDAYTARKSFALYTHIELADDSGTVGNYTLLAVDQSKAIAAMIELDGGYDDMSTVLVDAAGNYVFSSAEFQSDNLFKYFYVFNNLTLDTQNQLAADFAASTDGTYYYKDSRGRDCVFVYTAVPDTQWYSVSSVPLASFHNNVVDISYTIIIAVLLLLMLAFNVAWLLNSNRRLKVSAQKEKEASSAKTDFLSRMSHDIRTPLNVIIGSTILARREKNPPATQEYLDHIDQSGNFLLSLVNDILDLNKVESGKMELFPSPYSLAQFRANISAIIQPLCESKHIDFAMTGDDSDTAYLLDSTRVEQIVFNLLSNSVKFTDVGGHIRLDCQTDPISADKVMLTFRESDDGQGMSDEFQKRMFESFTQEHEGETTKSQGTGLGLAIVKNLVDLMGGTIRVESELEKGTTFIIAIPAEVAPKKLAPSPLSTADLASVAGKRVLLLEDNDLNAQIATALLEHEGVLVDRGADGVKGLAMFSASTPHYYDAILMDLRMPVMDGFETTHAMRALDRVDAATVPIIAMTANAYDEDVRKCLEAGMNAHLSKPIDPDIMFSTLDREMSKEPEG